MCGHRVKIEGHEVFGTVRKHDDFNYPMDKSLQEEKPQQSPRYWWASLSGGTRTPIFQASTEEDAAKHVMDNYGMFRTLKEITDPPV